MPLPSPSEFFARMVCTAGALLAAHGSALGRTVLLHPVAGSVTAESGGPVLGYCDEAERHDVLVSVNGSRRTVELLDGVFELDADWIEGQNVVAVGGQSVTFVSDPYADATAARHEPLADCGACHLLGPEQNFQLKEEPALLCAGCHRSEGRHASASCDDCHLPHASARPRLLREVDNGLCVACHRALGGAGAATAHGKIAAGPPCLGCHSPHEPSRRPEGGCETCHDHERGASGPHAAADCAACHVMHRDAAAARYKEPSAACAACHELPADGRHGSMAEQCVACHSVHRRSEPGGFTAALCASCHAVRAAESHGGDGEVMVRCENCHAPHEPRNAERTREACADCHPATALARRHVRPFRAGSDCLGCHRVHGGDSRGLPVRVPHAPYARRNCGVCHAGSEGALREPDWGPLCLTCHSEPADFTHAPARRGACGTCHSAHGGDTAGHLRRPVEVLCDGCHPQEARVLGSPHGAPMTCLACHDPHGGPARSYLRATDDLLCARCHADSSHASAAERCLACHDAHLEARPGDRKARPH